MPVAFASAVSTMMSCQPPRIVMVWPDHAVGNGGGDIFSKATAVGRGLRSQDRPAGVDAEKIDQGRIFAGGKGNLQGIFGNPSLVKIQ